MTTEALTPERLKEIRIVESDNRGLARSEMTDQETALADLLGEVGRLAALAPDGLTPIRFSVNDSQGRYVNTAQCVEIVRREQRDGSFRWAVFDADFVLNTDGEFEWEPQPSSRDDAFISRTRFDSASAALTQYRNSLTLQAKGEDHGNR